MTVSHCGIISFELEKITFIYLESGGETQPRHRGQLLGISSLLSISKSCGLNLYQCGSKGLCQLSYSSGPNYCTT